MSETKIEPMPELYAKAREALRESGVSAAQLAGPGAFWFGVADRMALFAAQEMEAVRLSPFGKRAADALADEVAALIRRRELDARSPAGDALLDYRNPPQTERSDRLAALEQQLAKKNASDTDEIDETLLARSERLAAALLAELDKHPRETWLPVLASGIGVAMEKETQPLREALEKISGIRDHIIGAQTVNWSLDIYPLVAVLKAVGITGADYEKTRAALLEEFATAHCETCRALDKIEDIANEFGEKYGALAIIGEWVGEYRHAHQLRAQKPDYKRRYEELAAATHESLRAHAVNEEARADDLAKRLSATDQELVQLRTENRTLRERLAAKGEG